MIFAIRSARATAALVVLDRNLFDVEPGEISQARVVLTLLGGEPVHGDLAALEAR